MYTGTVSRHQIPMIMTFEDRDIEIICDSLAHSLVEAYNIIEFFQFELDHDPFDEED